MSAAPIGYLKAEVYGLPFTFDGYDWTIPEIPEDMQILLNHTVNSLLSGKTQTSIHYHTPLIVRAKSMLEYSLGASNDWNWKIVEVKPSADWDKPLPPGWID